MEGLGGHKPGRPFRFAADWIEVVVEWVTEKAPRLPARSRWSCGALALLIRETQGVAVGPQDGRRRLRQGGLVYRRPRPVLGPTDEQREGKLAALRKVLADLPADETAVFPGRSRHACQPRSARCG